MRLIAGKRVHDDLVSAMTEAARSVVTGDPTDAATEIRDRAQKQDISIEHLLVMSSGLDADEGDPASKGFEDRLFEADDWLKFALSLPMAGRPGEQWVYASVNTFLLGVAIEETSRGTLADFAAEKLFRPLGISEFEWASTPTRRTVAQGNLSLRLRDMAKIGQMVLDGGRWRGKQVVPGDWISESVVGRFDVPWDGYDEYGYGWYLSSMQVEGIEYRYYFASGNGGNKVYLVPAEDLLVAVQSAAYNRGYGHRRSRELLRMILRASSWQNGSPAL